MRNNRDRKHLFERSLECVFVRGKPPFDSTDLSGESTQGRKEYIDLGRYVSFVGAAAPVVAERMSEATSRKELGLA